MTSKKSMFFVLLLILFAISSNAALAEPGIDSTANTDFPFHAGGNLVFTLKPNGTLDLAGGVRIGQVADNQCGPSVNDSAGMLRLKDMGTSKKVQYCDGTQWVDFGGSGCPETNFYCTYDGYYPNGVKQYCVPIDDSSRKAFDATSRKPIATLPKANQGDKYSAKNVVVVQGCYMNDNTCTLNPTATANFKCENGRWQFESYSGYVLCGTDSCYDSTGWYPYMRPINPSDSHY